MKSRISVCVIIGSLFIFSGCSNNQPQPKVITKIDKKEVIYIPSENEKKAIAILIHKQQELEKRIVALENNISITKSNKNNKKGSKNTTKCNFKNTKKELCSPKFDKKNYYVAVSNVNIRRCATVHSPVVGKIQKGEKVKFLYCNKYCWVFL